MTAPLFDTRPASPKQIAFATRLTSERALQLDSSRLTSLSAASAYIDELMRAPRPTMRTATPIERGIVPGMYRLANGDIFRVQASREDATRLYAKALTPIDSERLTETDAVVRFEFRYAAGAIHQLTPADRMSVDEAAAFGLRYGVCCVCGKTLTEAKSVARGIGPKCAGKV